MKHLKTTIDVIDMLGGNEPVAKLLGTTAKAVGNWRYYNLFPAHTYVMLQVELEKRNTDAPDYLWAMTLPPER